MVVHIVLTDRQARKLVEILDEYIERNEHNIYDFPDYWKPIVNLVKYIKLTVYKQLGEKEAEELEKEIKEELEEFIII